MKSTKHLYKNIPNSKSEKAKKFVALYGLFKSDLATGQVFGFIEHSLSMGWSNNMVRLWSLEDAQYFLKIAKDKNFKFFISRLTKTSMDATIVAHFEQRKRCYEQGLMKNFEFRNVFWTAVA